MPTAIARTRLGCLVDCRRWRTLRSRSLGDSQGRCAGSAPQFRRPVVLEMLGLMAHGSVAASPGDQSIVRWTRFAMPTAIARTRLGCLVPTMGQMALPLSISTQWLSAVSRVISSPGAFRDQLVDADSAPRPDRSAERGTTDEGVEGLARIGTARTALARLGSRDSRRRRLPPRGGVPVQ